MNKSQGAAAAAPDHRSSRALHGRVRTWSPRFAALWVLVLMRILAARPTGSGGPGEPTPPDVRDRGDVPGWVLITLMTAGLVTMLWAVAGEQLRELFTTALAAVTGPTR